MDEGNSNKKTDENIQAKSLNWSYNKEYNKTCGSWRVPGTSNYGKRSKISQNQTRFYGHYEHRRETFSGAKFKEKRDLNFGDSRRHLNNQNKDIHNRPMAFKTLQELAETDNNNILLKIKEKKEQFLNVITTLIHNDKPDLIVLIITIISKICQSPFEQLKLQLLLDICNSNFIGVLRNYLMDLPYVERKSKNSLYWNDQNAFWLNIITFYECVINLLPSVAIQKCRSLIEATTRSSLDGLNEKHDYDLSEDCTSKLSELRQRLTTCEIKSMIKMQQHQSETDLENQEAPPPDDFRELCILPNHDYLMDKNPYLRINVIDGAYKDTEHYLDVQFRLLREDCFGPLRDGLYQYKEDPNRKRFDNIRVYKNVQFIGPYITQNKAGLMVQIDNGTNKRLKRINWAHSKRLLFGSLLIFTKDNCKTLIVASVLDRDINYLAQGKIPVTIVDDTQVNVDRLYDDVYVMIESEVYFESYYHVLKALQDPNFPKHLAMTEYIINIKKESRAPTYLNENPVFHVKVENSVEIEIKVLELETWPSKEQLGLNESQYNAYQSSLTREFSLIQGPPGTGKTFLGVKIAETLLNNLKRNDESCIILVICYTNHALDQFLENILTVTQKIVRIGGQSRNEAIQKLNINKLRRNVISRTFHEHRLELKRLTREMKKNEHRSSALMNGVINYETLKSFVPESEIIVQYYNQKNNTDPLMAWLFEYIDCYDFNALLLEFEKNNENSKNVEELHTRKEVFYDDFSDDEDIEVGVNRETMKFVFTLSGAEKQLQSLILKFKNSGNVHEMKSLSQKIIQLKGEIELFKNMIVYRDIKSKIMTQKLVPPAMSTAARWQLYFKWAHVIISHVKTQIKPLAKQLHSANEAYEETRMLLDLELLKHAEIVGMTTTGAARLRKLLVALGAKIVIVEEAAEVLEAHIVTALTKDCQHIILIGDHQQLRPSAACTKLARRYNIEISLFERMIMNNVHSCRLDVQHRMRPEIAALISPHIYKDLKNHSSVNYFPHVRGMTADLFFFSHNFQEEEVDDSSSKANHQEADMGLALANYLMQQDYKPEDIVILAAYSGQMFYMKKNRASYAYLSEVKITVVDNYQGEEAKIILLSLVRHNENDKIGFLKTENRVCVALSRAREGFYIFGNIDILKRNSELWNNIANTLETNGCIGTSFKLRCENHENITNVSVPKDFEKVSEGGCLLKCNYNLFCGHQCPLICHGYDRSHDGKCRIKCTLPCEREICELNHKCPFKCWEQCKPCNKPVNKALPCGHDQVIACHLEPNDPAVKCHTIINVTLPHCGHKIDKQCHMNINKLKCQIPCVYRIDKCGHECRHKCHVTDDPQHEKYACLKPCAKAKKGCTADLVGDRREHQCYKKCYEKCDYCNVQVKKKRSNCKHTEYTACCKDIDETPCNKKCARTLPCNHFCMKKCYEKCGDCKQKVVKIIPDCNHEISIHCMTEPTRKDCRSQCARVLSCGHRCKDICRIECDPTKCIETVNELFNLPCGHQVKLPCNVYKQMINNELKPDMLLKYCTAPCNLTLDCQHTCAGTCAQCYQGRLHVPCKETCHQLMICGHECQEPCNVACPPCKMKCEIKCSHTLCGKLCGELCTPCKEKCSRVCVHGACTNRCGEPCSRPPCNEPCPSRLPCGHRCRGLCGELCPNICKLCHPEEFPTDFLGDEFDDNEMFIKFQDCVHVLSVSDMDNLMTGDLETIKIRQCPLCRKPIINTHRYKDVVNKMFREDINPIKEKVYGHLKTINEKKSELKDIVTTALERHCMIYTENKYWFYAFNKLTNKLKNKKITMLQLEMHQFCFNVLDKIGNCYNEYTKEKLSKLKDEFVGVIKMICNTLMSNSNKISKQQQMDIVNEVQRIKSIVQFSRILTHTAYEPVKNIPKVMEAKEAANQAILSWNIFEEDKAFNELKNLENSLKASNIITKPERDLIVQAMGLKSGHWFKCPNGHCYCITECGGAMEIGKCNECGANIGGTNHDLLSSNHLAPEMDNARFPAWSNMNNMLNFDLNL